MIEIIIVVLILLMLVGALVAIETSNMLYSVISVGAIGFLLSIIFLFLSAPDLAITQMAVEVITLVLLLKATRQAEPDTNYRISFGKVVAVVMVFLLALFTAAMFAEFPEFGSPVMDRFTDAPSNTYLSTGLEETGAANIVTAVLLDFRAYDTLGEATVLFCAVMGARTILRRQVRSGPAESNEVKTT